MPRSSRLSATLTGEAKPSLLEESQVIGKSSDGERTTSPDADTVLSDLIPLENGFSQVPFWTRVAIFSRLILPSLYLGLTYHGSDILDMYGFYLANKSNDLLISSSFGLMIFFSTLVIFGVYYAIDEKIALSTSQELGSGNFQAVKRIYWQGYLTVILVTLVFFSPMIIYSEHVLMIGGINPENAKLTSTFLKRLFPIEILRMANEVSLTFTLAQGVDFNYGMCSIFVMLASQLAGIVADLLFGLQMTSWLIARLIHELLLAAVILYVLLYVCDPKTRGILPVKDILKGFGGFFTSCLGFIISIYAEWLGAEVAIYFTCLTKDMAQIAAHTALQNFGYLVVNTAMGFSITGRTRVNM